MEDLCQDTKKSFYILRVAYGIFLRRKCSIKSLVNQLRRENFLFGLTEQFLQGNFVFMCLINEKKL